MTLNTTQTETTYNVILTRNDSEEIVLRFNLNGESGLELNLESEDSTKIQNVFSKILKKLVETGPIKFELTIDKESIGDKSDLFIDTAEEYIKQLNNDLVQIENDQDLATLRKFLKEK